MTSVIISSTGIPVELNSPQIKKPSEIKGKEINSKEVHFKLPLPGNEGFLEFKGQVTKSGIEKVEALKKQGHKLPNCLEKCLKWCKLAFKCLEKGSNSVVSCLGCALKYLGLALLVAGTIHIFVVLFTTSATAIAAGGLIVLITSLVTKGAIPTLLAGGSLYFFGKNLLKNEPPALHNFLNGFPIISYFMTLIPSSYNPNNPHNQNN